MRIEINDSRIRIIERGLSDQEVKKYFNPIKDMAFERHCLFLYRLRDKLLAKGIPPKAVRRYISMFFWY